jgi:hypothetical protein
MKGNLVHSYITGFKFNNIFGGQTDDYSRSITQINYLTPMSKQRWPWMQGMWQVSDHARSYGYFDTLEEAKAEAQRIWPGCGFKTPAEFRAEEVEL